MACDTVQLSQLHFDSSFVRNREDGTVELEVMGDEEEVNEFITEIVEESELAGLIKEQRIWDIDELANCRGFTIAN
ncbi:acylphosphatase [Akkermansiaceae bacterium]|nr:acylphosphatase [Akkermansiaceae bacterium]